MFASEEGAQGRVRHILLVGSALPAVLVGHAGAPGRRRLKKERRVLPLFQRLQLLVQADDLAARQRQLVPVQEIQQRLGVSGLRRRQSPLQGEVELLDRKSVV